MCVFCMFPSIRLHICLSELLCLCVYGHMSFDEGINLFVCQCFSVFFLYLCVFPCMYLSVFVCVSVYMLSVCLFGCLFLALCASMYIWMLRHVCVNKIVAVFCVYLYMDECVRVWGWGWGVYICIEYLYFVSACMSVFVFGSFLWENWNFRNIMIFLLIHLLSLRFLPWAS